jgi:hypothetical protein
MIVKELKDAIDINIPNEKEYLVWIINHVGQIIFQDKWSEFNIYKNEPEKYPEIIFGIIKMIDVTTKNKKEKTELINYVFSQSLIKLNK